MMTMTQLPEGIIPPVLTPLTPDRKPDIPALKRLIERVLAGGVSGLFMGGTVGLGSILSTADYEQVIATALEIAPDDVPVLCGVLEPSTARAVERIRLLESLQAKYFVTVPPFFVRAQHETAVLRHFGALRDSTDMEMILYNIPVCTGMNLEPHWVRDMVERGWTQACKDSSGDKVQLAALCQQKDVGLKVYQGMAPDFAWLNELGASGGVTVTANVYPELYVSAWNNRADEVVLPPLQQQCDEAWSQLVKEGDFASGSLKQLAQMGIGSGTLALPFE